LAPTRKREGREEGKRVRESEAEKMEMGERLSPEERGKGGKEKRFRQGNPGKRKRKGEVGLSRGEKGR
jgi:hypothetical protein